VESGTYVLCWCGPGVKRTRPDIETDVPYHQGGWASPCPSARPTNGHGFLAPAGYLVVTGADPQGTVSCSIGLNCVISGVTGEGVQGGDQVAVLRVCGEEPPNSDRYEWTTLAPGADTTTVTTTAATTWSTGLDKWIDGGWLEWGPNLSTSVLNSIGIGGATGRAMWGFPNFGYSVPDSRAGYYQWGGPTWAYAGEYQLCWCGGGQGDNDLAALLERWTLGEGEWCSLPEHYLVPMGTLKVVGPSVLPTQSQVFRCVRRRACEITDFEGTMPDGSKLLISESACSSAEVPTGSPNEGQSLPSDDGTTFSWGSKEGTFQNPGFYRLCWCASVVDCYSAEDYTAYAGLLQVKAPTAKLEKHWCALGQACNITGLVGMGLHNGDSIAALAVCGYGEFSSKFTRNGVSTATFGVGHGFTMPPATEHGVFRICWCAGETLCYSATDFDTDVGALEVGGPDASAVYVCYEWQPCSITVKGSLLHVGDMIRVVPSGADCATTALSTSGPELIDGFPHYGVAYASTDGYEYSFGEELVRTDPGLYDLCYCSYEYSPDTCQSASDFYTPGGTIRIATSAEYQYATRVEDPSERSFDPLYGIILAIVLPCIFALAAVVGWGRNRVFRRLVPGGGKTRVRKLEISPPHQKGPPGKDGNQAAIEGGGDDDEDAEPEAPPLFKPREGFAALAQKANKETHEVKQILEIRLAAPGTTSATVPPPYQKKGKILNAHISDIPDFRSERAKRRAARRARGEDSESEQEQDSDMADHSSMNSQSSPEPLANSAQSGLDAFKLGGQQSSTLEMSQRMSALDSSQALRDTANSKTMKNMRSSGSMMSMANSRRAQKNREMAFLDAGPRPPGLNVPSRVVTSSRLLDVLDL